MNYVVVLVVILGKDDDPVSLAQLLHGLPEGADDPHVVAHPDGVGVIEEKHRAGIQEGSLCFLASVPL